MPVLSAMLRGACLVAVILGGEGIASAQSAAAPVPVSFEYTSSVAGCPSEQELRAGVTAELGRDPFDDLAGERVVVVIRADGRHFKAEIRVRSSGTEAARVRVIESRAGDCRELTRTLTLALCLLIDPLYVETAPGGRATDGTPAGSETPSKTSSPAPPTVTPSGADEPRAVSRSERDARAKVGVPIRGYAGLSALAGFGLAPGIGPGMAFELGARRGSLALGLEARLELPRRTEFDGGTLEVAPRVLSLVPCALPAPFAVCALVSGGDLRASGSGYPVNHGGHALFASVGARLAIEAGLGLRLSLRAFVDAQAMLSDTEFIANRRVAWSTGFFVAASGVSAFVTFG